MSSIEFIDDAAVEKLLNWPLVIQAVDQALRSVCPIGEDAENRSKVPISQQPARSFTTVPGISLSLMTLNMVLDYLMIK